MDEFKKRLIHLLHVKPFSWKMIYSILKRDPDLNSLYTSMDQPFDLSFMKRFPIDQLLEHYGENHIQVISFLDKEYPEILKNIYQPPWILFAKGDISLLNNDFLIAVVGSREASDYGKNVIDFLFPELLAENAVIVSGLARGIDTYAHKAAIKQRGRTVAVIAGGFNHIYPKENLPLAQKMMQEQLVLSEYPPATRPERWQFPLRNRIISGITRGTLVIEAKKRSGSFITADCALNEGREVFSVPGNILSPYSEGTNELIKLGAKLVKQPHDIIEEIFLSRHNK